MVLEDSRKYDKPTDVFTCPSKTDHCHEKMSKGIERVAGKYCTDNLPFEVQITYGLKVL